MDDLELAAKTHNDILTFFGRRSSLKTSIITAVRWQRRAEGMFQWAAVACGYILDPPEFFDFSRTKCVEHLLKPPEDYHRPDPLDEL